MQVVAPGSESLNVKDVTDLTIDNWLADHIDVHMHLISKLLTVGYVLGYIYSTTLVGLAFDESRHFFAGNQVLDLLLHLVRAINIVIHHINNRDQQKLVTFFIGILLPRLGHLFKIAHTVDFDEDTLLGAEEVETTTAILEVLLKLHTQLIVLDETPNAIFAKFLHVGAIGEAGTALNHALVDHPLERLVFA